MTNEKIGATPDIDNESLGTKLEENNSSSESLSVAPDPVVQKETTELSSEVVQTQFDKKLEDLTNYSETLKNLRPHFDEYLEEKHGDLIEVLSTEEKNLVEIALWNEVMKINIDGRFGDVAEKLMGTFSEILGEDQGEDNEEETQEAGNAMSEAMQEITEKFDKTLEDPIKKIKEYKSIEGASNFKTPGEVYGVIEGEDARNNVEFMKVLQENQDTFLEQFEDKGGVNEAGEKFIGLVNKSGPLKKTVVKYLEGFSKIPIIGSILALLFGPDFLSKLKEPYNPVKDMWESLTGYVGEKIDSFQNDMGKLLSKWSPNDKEKEKSMKNIKSQAKKADIDTEDESFWSKVFNADENDTSYFSQLKKHLNTGVEKAEDINDYFLEKFTSFEFDKDLKTETND